jgi:hypothetical protein
MSSVCEVCGTSDLPGGLSACCYGDDCLICEDCMCKNCNSIESCEKHCHCQSSEDNGEISENLSNEED